MRAGLLLAAAMALFIPLQPVTAQQVQPIFRFPLNTASQCNTGTDGHAGYRNPAIVKDALDFNTSGPNELGYPQEVVAAADGLAYAYAGCDRVAETCRTANSPACKCNSGFGNFVKLRHGPDLYTMYSHLDKITIPSNTMVRAGDKLGVAGKTGFSSGDHLHFALHKGRADIKTATFVDPTLPFSDIYVRNTSSPFSSMEIIDGDQFVCGIQQFDGVTGDIYAPAEAPRCDVFDERQSVISGFGAAYDLYADARPAVLLQALCTESRTQVSLGNQSRRTYVFHRGYEWVAENPDSEPAWKSFPIQCTNEKVADLWCVGAGIANLDKKSEYFVGFICQWEDGRWRCGCGDRNCSERHWALQKIKMPR